MAHTAMLETVNVVENNFSVDSRDRSGKRVVSFDAHRTLQVYLLHAHIVQIEVVVDVKEATERSILLMSSGARYITARAASAIAADLAKAG
jgi:hypothetical protein